MSDSPEQPKTQRTMLVIDDQHSVRVSLVYLLRLSGYNVIGADSGANAIVLAATESVDGALIDVHMPVMNGLETCVRLQAQARTLGRELRVWFMTGAFTGDLERRSARLGALGVFAKPFECPSFLARLEAGFSSPLPSLPSTTVDDGASSSNPP
ncbi:MAG: response regulator [Opitutaceae bacterium]|nr:response regulator [Opitutaceae bacterium]